jgi:hypothetical protein
MVLVVARLGIPPGPETVVPKTASRSDDAAELTFRQMRWSSVTEQKKAKRRDSD